MLTSLFQALGCSVANTDDRFGAARVTYLEDGRPKDIEVFASHLSKECAPAVAVLAFLTFADPSQPARPADAQWLMLPMDSAAVGCADQPRRDSNPPLKLGQRNIAPPNKTRHVNPSYPAAALKARVQGVVVIESEITETGCVRRSKVVRSIPELDLAALRAVSSWAFTPARLDGQVVPVIMTVTVNFTLE